MVYCCGLNRKKEKAGMGKNGMKKKKTPIRGTVITVLIYLGLGIAMGLIFAPYLNGREGETLTRFQELLRFAVIIAVFYAATVIQTGIHEAGHLVFGLLSGYRFTSYRVFNLMWIRVDGQIRFRRTSIAGTGGQCLMEPPELKDGKIPVLLYNYGGAIMNLISAAVFAGLALLCRGESVPRGILLSLAVCGAAYTLLNALPLSIGGVNNDGLNALDMVFEPKAVRAFWIQMKANALSARGMRLREMPEEWFAVPDEESMKNAITAGIGALAASRLMDELKFDEAESLIKELLAQDNALVGLYRNLMTCDRMYIELIGENRPEVLESLRTKEQLKFMKAMKNYPSVLRTEYTRALLGEKDRKKAKKIRGDFEKISGSFPYPRELEAEGELMEIAEKKEAEISASGKDHE